ncbi:hypothetical protein EBU71_02365 [bacterium]|nr:hypothetical protein [Candidatus Elulimicrobium humile]
MKINVYQEKNYPVTFDTLKVNRVWMDNTFDRHAYHCFPLSLSNLLGWTFYYPEDIVFRWNGKDPNSLSEDLKIISGERFVHPNRANGTISFNTGLTVQSEQNISILIMPVPNQFIDGVQCFTSIISTSVLRAELPCAWKVTKSNEEIVIPANTPIASIVPISLKKIEEFDFNIYDANFSKDYIDSLSSYGKASEEITKNGNWTGFYRNATDENSNIIGKHELKTLRLKINDCRNNE